MRLTENFTRAEFCKSYQAIRLGIVNDLPDELVESALLVCEDICQPVREFYNTPYSIGSGYRCLTLNRALESKDTSQHVLAEAVDIEVPRVDNLELARWIQANCDFDQLILEHYTSGNPSSGWVHASAKLDRDTNRFEVLTYFGGGLYKQGLVG